MAQRIVLHYFPGNSLLHQWDARCKFIGLLMMTVTLLQSKILWLILDSGIFLSLLVLSRLPLIRFIRDIWIWAVLLLVLSLFQIFFTPGPTLLPFQWLPVSKDGLLLSGLAFWRLGLMISCALLFTAVTRPSELRDAIIWFLKPLPFLPARRIGLMVSLTLRFFSLILDQAEEVRLAHKARLGDREKNPFRRAKFLALPILRRSLSQAEEVTLALAARGYRDDIALQLPKLRLTHVIPLLIFTGLLMIIRWTF